MIVRLEATITKGTLEREDIREMIENDDRLELIEPEKFGNLYKVVWGTLFIEDQDDAVMIADWADFIRGPAIRSIGVVEMDESRVKGTLASRGG